MFQRAHRYFYSRTLKCIQNKYYYGEIKETMQLNEKETMRLIYRVSLHYKHTKQRRSC